MTKVDNLLWQARFERQRNWLYATKLLQQALEQEPRRAEIAHELAEVYISQRLFKPALEVLGKILSYQPDDDDAHFKAGNCLLAMGRNDEALIHYQKVMNYTPELLYNLAIACMRLKRTEECIQALELLINEYPLTDLPYYFLTEQYLQNNQPDKALKLLERMDAQFGPQANINIYKAKAAQQLQNWLKVYAECQTAHNLGADNGEQQRLWGLAAERIGRSSESIDHLLESLRLDPYNTFTYVDLINIFIVHQQYDDALAIAEHAQEIKQISSVLGQLYKKLLELYPKSDKKSE